MKKETFATPWKKVAENWEKYYAPPGRPSAEDCKHYAEFVKRSIKNKKDTRALVLGATPEIRNLLHNLGIPATIVDINLEMILAMNRSVPKAASDIIVCDNWVSNTIASEQFDVILGDLTWANVPRDQWNKLHKNLQRLLKPGGYYIQRVTLIPDNWKFEPAMEILKKYSRLPYTEQRHFELFIHLLINSFDGKTKKISIDVIRRGLLSVWRNGKIIKQKQIPGADRLLRRIFAFWGNGSKEWQTDYSVNLEKEIALYFTIADKVISKDYLCADALPFWYCQVKK